MSTLAPLPSLPGISQSTGTDYTGLDEAGVDAALNAPMTDDEINQAMGYNYTGSSTAPTIPSIPTTGYDTPSSAAASSTNAAASNVVTATTGVLTSIWNIVTGNIENGIFVVLGLLLIAAGIFAFKPTQTLAVNAGKLGAKAAEVAAA